ncbi:MAG TPA: hypothetical protein VFX36_12030 [Nitrospira sp.]|nr:hypothetical protein [Nitrospira sp.]
MRAILLILLACLLTSCLSATREREANCLAATIMDVWQTEHELTSAEQVWRTAQQAADSDRTAQSRSSSELSIRVADAPPIIRETAARFESFGFPASRSQEDARLYQRMIDARARHGQASKWYGLVARRVQTRIEEDEMLYPVLGMLATSTAIVLYPLVRWNVRSVLWDGADPDADDDPVQRFCAARLEERHRSLVP